jgi:hypothetical protein
MMEIIVPLPALLLIIHGDVIITVQGSKFDVRGSLTSKLTAESRGPQRKEDYWRKTAQPLRTLCLCGVYALRHALCRPLNFERGTSNDFLLERKRRKCEYLPAQNLSDKNRQQCDVKQSSRRHSMGNLQGSPDHIG